jgi:hypothetical protein
VEEWIYIVPHPFLTSALDVAETSALRPDDWKVASKAHYTGLWVDFKISLETAENIEIPASPENQTSVPQVF